MLAAAAFAVPAANAGLIGNLLGGNCPSGGSQVFAPWQDFANYFLAPNGSFEFGTHRLVALGRRRRSSAATSRSIPTGTHSLSLPSGSSATSPTVCLGPKQLYVRMFGADPAAPTRACACASSGTAC